MYREGIALAENYSRYFLTDLYSRTSIIEREKIWFWKFDTDFYLLTMYDHIGHTEKCDEYLKKCRRNIRAKPKNNNGTGEIVEVERPIHRSNVMLVDPKTKKPTRVKVDCEKNGKKIRISKKSNEKID